MSTTTYNDRQQKYRVVFLGDQNVGKSSIIERYTTNCFDQSYNATVGIDFDMKDFKYGGHSYRLQIWDTAGQQRYRSLIPTYLKNAHCVVYVYDVSQPNSLQHLIDWYNVSKQNNQSPGVIVGNKIDLEVKKSKNVQIEDICKKFNMKYIEVSAKTGKKIEDLFQQVISQIIENRIIPKEEQLRLQQLQQSSKKNIKINKKTSVLDKIVCCSE